MATTLIYERIKEINGTTYHVEHWPTTLQALEAQHANHDIYLYEPPIVPMPILEEGKDPIIGATTYPTTWTPVSPIVAIVVEKAS